MLMVFQAGMCSEQYWKTSVTRRMEWFGGYMCVPRAMYSLRMSFWRVPFSWWGDTPCFLAAAT